jgi:hypothetical protein
MSKGFGLIVGSAREAESLGSKSTLGRGQPDNQVPPDAPDRECCTHERRVKVS